MVKTAALSVYFLANLAIGAAFAAAFLPGGAPGWAPYVVAVALAAALVAAMTFGAARGGRVGRLALPFAFVFVVLAGGFVVLLAVPPADPADPALWLGLPPRAAVLLLGVGLLPLFVVPLAYAWTFEEMTLSEEDLARIRAAARSAVEAEPATSAPDSR